jgi:hypothetical protein
VADGDRVKTLLAEYAEICAYQRHEDSMKWTVAGLTYTGAAASIAWTATTFPYLLGLALIVAGGLIWVGARVYEQFHVATRIRLERAIEIERELKLMDHHTRVDRHNVARGYVGELPYVGGLAWRLIATSKVLSIVLTACGILSLPAAMIVYFAQRSISCGRW